MQSVKPSDSATEARPYHNIYDITEEMEMAGNLIGTLVLPIDANILT